MVGKLFFFASVVQSVDGLRKINLVEKVDGIDSKVDGIDSKVDDSFMEIEESMQQGVQEGLQQGVGVQEGVQEGVKEGVQKRVGKKGIRDMFHNGVARTKNFLTGEGFKNFARGAGQNALEFGEGALHHTGEGIKDFLVKTAEAVPAGVTPAMIAGAGSLVGTGIGATSALAQNVYHKAMNYHRGNGFVNDGEVNNEEVNNEEVNNEPAEAQTVAPLAPKPSKKPAPLAPHPSKKPEA